MSGQFKVGDICIGQNHVIDTHLNGMECTVVQGVTWGIPLGKREPDHYVLVEWANGEKTASKPFHLRRKPPKQSTDEWAESKVRELTKPVVQPEGVPA
jgi:hypothetical protein